MLYSVVNINYKIPIIQLMCVNHNILTRLLLSYPTHAMFLYYFDDNKH